MTAPTPPSAALAPTPAIAPVTPEGGALRAKFNPLIRPSLVLQIGGLLAMSIVGLPLALIWFLGVGQWWARHYFDKLDCHLDERKLRYQKGILVTVEKTIPLENIQDVTFVEGPILRRFQLSTLKFETGGSSAGQANAMHLTGIIDAHQLRDKILERRDALKHQSRALPAAPAADGSIAAEQLAALRGIERKLDELVALLKERS
ncbi:MAG: PH domain-containing protein [Polyangiaceae bacterium]